MTKNKTPTPKYGEMYFDHSTGKHFIHDGNDYVEVTAPDQGFQSAADPQGNYGPIEFQGPTGFQGPIGPDEDEN